MKIHHSSLNNGNKTTYFNETSCPTGSRLVEGCLRGPRPTNPSGTHSLAYTLLAPANTPTTNRGMPTQRIAIYNGDKPVEGDGVGGFTVGSST